MLTNHTALFHSSQIRDCERIAARDLGIPETELMMRAGQAAFQVLRQQFSPARKLAVFCGSGNNAGDGYVLARLAHDAGYTVTIHQYKAPEHLPPAARAAALAVAMLPCLAMEDAIDQDTDLIVDALLGTGLRGVVQEPVSSAIQAINASGIPVLSLDVPSGLHADTGQIPGACVRADVTITFIGCKTGMLTLDGPDCCGALFCDDLSLGACLSTIHPAARIIEAGGLAKRLPARRRNCHKRDFGHVLIIGGDYGMAGSVFLAAQAALRTGAGMVSIATRSEHARQTPALLPEAMVHAIDTAQDLLPLITSATHCVLGPGLGVGAWGEDLFHQTMASQLPMIIDASALRLLAKFPQRDDNWVLTPHPGEAASLLACSTQAVQQDRFHSASLLQAKFGGQVVLKGSGSLVCNDEGQLYVCDAGNPGMASAGMGDVLSGVIAGLAAQGLSLADAACQGVWLHARAGDLAAEAQGERGLLATDLMPRLRQLVNGDV